MSKREDTGSTVWQNFSFSTEPTDEQLVRQMLKAAKCDDLRSKLFVKAKGRCLYCKKGMWRAKPDRLYGDYVMTIDHFTPKSKGGANQRGNYVAACRRCNERKSNMMPDMYLARRALAVKRIPLGEVEVTQQGQCNS